MKLQLLKWVSGFVFYVWSAACFAQPPVILILGDSLSSGHGMPIEQGWVHLLQIQLRDNGYPHQVVNASISGDTATQGQSRLGPILESHRPDIVIVELGGNDGLRATPVDTVRDSLAAIIRMARDSPAKVLLAGIRLPPNYGPDYVQAFESLYPDLAEEYGTGLVPFFMDGVATAADTMQEDGIHPNARAQPVLLQNVWPHLEPMLKR